MSDGSKIEWTEATWNPVTGCSKVSPGCKHCYAERDWPRLAAPRAKPNIYTGRDFTDVKCHPEKLGIPLRWTKPRRIFVNSMSDLFHEAVPFEFVDAVWLTMIKSQQHIFQILTKRPQRMLEFFEWESKRCEHPTLPNVWLGVSCENQETFDERWRILAKVPAAVRWFSLEPMIGRIDMCEAFGMWWNQTMHCFEGSGSKLNPHGFSWVVAGGESGPHARPMHPDWVRAIRDQCQAAGVPFFFKQWGEWAPPTDGAGGRKIVMHRFGKKAAGRSLDGRTWDEYPA
jgi:protein gp37